MNRETQSLDQTEIAIHDDGSALYLIERIAKRTSFNYVMRERIHERLFYPPGLDAIGASFPRR